MVNVERYFGFGIYDNALGGLADLIFKSDSLEDVKTALIKYRDDDSRGGIFWIADMETFKNVNFEI